MRRWHFAKWQILAWHDGHPDFAACRALLRQEKMTTDEIEALRLAKTRRLVAECIRHVPYYGDLMRKVGMTPESLRDPRDLEVLPLLTRDIVRAEKTRILNESAPPLSYFAHATGGSTGTPLHFYRGYEYNKLANTAAYIRSLHRMGWRPGDRLAKVWAPHDDEEDPGGLVGIFRRKVRRWLEPPDIFLNSYETSLQDMQSWIPRMRTFRPRFLYGYASNLTLFARLLHRNGIRIDGVRGISSTALALFPNDRSLLREAFPGATVIDMYGSREIPGIAAECDRGKMHINSDLVHVEYLPVPGEPGHHRLIVTALDNTVFPFIRYDIGDYGSPLAGNCCCGLPFPAMHWGFGKVSDSFVSPEGKVMTGLFFEALMDAATGVHAYQFRQRTETEIVLNFVPSDDYGDTTRKHLAWVEQEIRRQFSALVRLRVELVEFIPLTPAGKHRLVVSEVHNPLLDADGAAGTSTHV